MDGRNSTWPETTSGSVALAIYIYYKQHQLICASSVSPSCNATIKALQLYLESSFPPPHHCLFNHWESNSSTIREKYMVTLVKTCPLLCSAPATKPSLVCSCPWLPHIISTFPHPPQVSQPGLSTTHTFSECLLSTSHKEDPAPPHITKLCTHNNNQ